MKVELASLLMQLLPTVVAQKTLLGMVMVVEMLHDARAAAEALLEGTRNEAGKCSVHSNPRTLIRELQPWLFSYQAESG